MSIGGPSILSCIVAMLIGVLSVNSASSDPVHTVAAFNNARTSTELMVATDGSQDSRTAALVFDTNGTSSQPTHRRIVVAFTKKDWPTFEGIWDDARSCLARIAPSLCPERQYSDSTDHADLIVYPVVGGAIYLYGKDVEHGEIGFEFSGENERGLTQMRDAIRSVSDYLNQ